MVHRSSRGTRRRSSTSTRSASWGPPGPRSRTQSRTFVRTPPRYCGAPRPSAGMTALVGGRRRCGPCWTLCRGGSPRRGATGTRAYTTRRSSTWAIRGRRRRRCTARCWRWASSSRTPATSCWSGLTRCVRGVRAPARTTGVVTAFVRRAAPQVCDCVLRYKDAKNQLVRRTVVTLMPRLATFQPQVCWRRRRGRPCVSSRALRRSYLCLATPTRRWTTSS